jgi:hypothetical protein
MRIVLLAAATLFIAAPAFADGPCSYGSTHTVMSTPTGATAAATTPAPQTPPQTQPNG